MVSSSAERDYWERRLRTAWDITRVSVLDSRRPRRQLRAHMSTKSAPSPAMCRSVVESWRLWLFPLKWRELLSSVVITFSMSVSTDVSRRDTRTCLCTALLVSWMLEREMSSLSDSADLSPRPSDSTCLSTSHLSTRLVTLPPALPSYRSPRDSFDNWTKVSLYQSARNPFNGVNRCGLLDLFRLYLCWSSRHLSYSPPSRTWWCCRAYHKRLILMLTSVRMFCFIWKISFHCRGCRLKIIRNTMTGRLEVIKSDKMCSLSFLRFVTMMPASRLSLIAFSLQSWRESKLI